MSMAPNNDLIITVLPVRIEAFLVSTTSFVSASSWSLDLFGTIDTSLWVIFEQWLVFKANEAKYSKMEQVKFVEDSLQKI